jgi:hypothetical protein
MPPHKPWAAGRRDVDDEVETNGDGYKAEYVLCEDGPYYLTFDKDYKLTSKEKQD